MLTTEQINVDLKNKERKLERTTTKEVDASFKRIEKPKEKPKDSPVVSTNKMGTLEAIRDKEMRDKIMAERKAQRTASTKEGGEGLKKLAMQYVFVEFDGLIQAISRRELK